MDRIRGFDSVLADGHLSITFPGGTVVELQRHLKSGGLLFPYNVHVDERGELFIRSKLNGDATPLAGARIEMLDGVPAGEVAAKLLAHTNGDTRPSALRCCRIDSPSRTGSSSANAEPTA